MFHARQRMPKQQEVAKAFSKHIKSACIHDHENNKSTRKCREWWVMVNICIPHRGNGETAAFPLHWCHTTWRFMLSQKLFFGGSGSCRERRSWQLFLGPLMSCRLYHEAWFVHLHLEQTGKHRFEQPVLFLYALSALKRAQKADYVLFGDAKYNQQ